MTEATPHVERAVEAAEEAVATLRRMHDALLEAEANADPVPEDESEASEVDMVQDAMAEGQEAVSLLDGLTKTLKQSFGLNAPEPEEPGLNGDLHDEDAAQEARETDEVAEEEPWPD